MKIYLSHCVLVIPEYYLTQALSICVNMLSAAMLRCYTECFHAESHIFSHYVECYYTLCNYTKCHYNDFHSI
jgi:hypothetical protein